MNILHLTLKSKWFNMILSGEKKEEYREMKLYWKKRLIEDPRLTLFKFKKFDTVTFKNGYSKKARTMIVEFKSVEIGVGLYVMGAPNYPVFIIKLGKILETKNI